MFKRGGVSTVRRIQLKNEPSDKIPIFRQSKGNIFGTKCFENFSKF